MHSSAIIADGCPLAAIPAMGVAAREAGSQHLSGGEAVRGVPFRGCRSLLLLDALLNSLQTLPWRRRGAHLIAADLPIRALCAISYACSGVRP